MAPHSTITTVINSEQVSECKDATEDIKTSANCENKIRQYGKYRFFKWEFETPLIWKNIISICVLHVLAVYFLLTHSYYSHPGIVLYAFLIGGIGGFGITAGAHRYWTHRSFKAKLPLRIILLICYTVAGQNSLKDWVRDHRVHHKFSETDADPHNVKRGFFYAHVGWLMMRRHPDTIRKGQQVDYGDIFEDPLVIFHQKYFLWLKILFCFIIPTIVPTILWGESLIISIRAIVIVRYACNLNFTWLVNSAAHLWGTKPYDMRIKPVENLTVSLLAMGEGYHNYHHTFPWDYRASEIGKSLNVTTFWLNIFEKIGWAYDMKSPSQELVKKVVLAHGDGTHYKWGHEIPYETTADHEETFK